MQSIFRTSNTLKLVYTLILCFIFEQIMVRNDIIMGIFFVSKENLFSLITSFSALLFHSNLAHLLNNLIVLFILGIYLEKYYNKNEEICFLFFLGAIANFMYAYFFMDNGYALLGASTGVAVLLSYSLFLSENWLVKLIILKYMLADVLPLFFVDTSNVAHGAHILGYMVGIMAFLYEKIDS